MSAKIAFRPNRVVGIECYASLEQTKPTSARPGLASLATAEIKLLARAFGFNKSPIIDKSKYKWVPPKPYSIDKKKGLTKTQPL